MRSEKDCVEHGFFILDFMIAHSSPSLLQYIFRPSMFSLFNFLFKEPIVSLFKLYPDSSSRKAIFFFSHLNRLLN